METVFRALGFVFLFASLSYGASVGAISGVVKGPNGSPLKGAFVRAQDEKTRITVSVLSDRQGSYRIENLTAGEYRVRATAVGYKSDPRNNVKVDGAKPVSLDFTLQKGVVRWADLSNHQGEVLLPAGPGKTEMFGRCLSCHGLQTKIAATRRDEDGWRSCVSLMRDLAGGVGVVMTDQVADAVVAYLTRVFGEDSEFARSPVELPGYEKVQHGEFSDEASKIVYVDYDLPGPDRIPWDAAPLQYNKPGNVWFPESETADGIGKLNPETGEIVEYKVPPVPHVRSVHVHSVVEGPDGMVWFADIKQCQLNRFDPETQKFTAYTPPSCQGRDPTPVYNAGGPDQVRVDRLGNVWANGQSGMWRFDPKTEKFTEFPEGGRAYGFELDKKEGNVWFAQLFEGKIGMIDIGTLKLKRWTPPATVRLASINKDQPEDVAGFYKTHPRSAGPRRITSDNEGVIWFGEWWAGQIGRFDPKTETFKEFKLPDPDPTPYGVGVDRNGLVWYSSYNDDIIGRLDPRTGKVVEFPFPYSGNGIRELLPDSEGRMWFGTPFNDKVGYFIPPEGLKTLSTK